MGSRVRFARYRRERRTAQPQDDRTILGETKSAKQRSLLRLYRELNRALEGNRAIIIAGLAISSIVTLLKLIPPAATKLLVDNVFLRRPLPAGFPTWVPVPSDPRARLLLLAAVVFGVSVLGTAIGLLSRWMSTLASKRVQIAMRRKVFEHASRLPLHRVYQLKAGGASSVLRDDAGGVGELVFSMLYNPWRAVVQFAGGLVVLAWVDGRLLLASLLLVPAVYGSDRLWNRRLRPLYRDVRKQRQEIDAKTTEAFGGMRVVRAFGRQKRESARFVGENHFMARQELFAWWCTRLVEVLWDLLLPAASGVLLLYGGLQVLDGRLSPGDLMMFLVYLAMLLEPVSIIAMGVTQLQNNLSGFDRVLDLLAEPREMVSRPGAITIHKPSVIGRIALSDVSFQYPSSDTLVIRDVNLDIEPGEVVALVGKSGSGKTTLCNLIARFYDPTEGTISLDGVDLRDIDVESYRRLLGIVEQDVFLFDGTIEENIAYANRNATRAEIERAARAANAAEFIDSFPEGYDTLIGERGVRISGGQRQRLAIARAVLADPRIFILDEATSNLDSESEQLIQRSLSTLLHNRTSFVIAHRLSTIRNADRILVMEGGSIIEAGTHAELLSRHGRYRDMVELQRVEEVELKPAIDGARPL
jgi:ATP-binding cassette subfamily B protein/subfamily B ATP-binding cassette protein MsbA